jgi:ferredoxin-type protein NapH
MKIGYIRHIVQAQILILVLYDVINSSALTEMLWKIDPILSFSTALVASRVSIEFIVFSIALIIATAVSGRVFCGWICPLGFIQDLTSLHKKGSWIDEGVRLLKYSLLVGGIAMLLMVRWSFLEWVTPASILSRAVGSLWEPQKGLLGLTILALALIITFATEKRAWCRYICPLGALLSLTSIKKAVGIKINQNKCTKCQQCEKKCTMGIIDIKDQIGLRWNSECISCLTCRDTCPVNAISLIGRVDLN